MDILGDCLQFRTLDDLISFDTEICMRVNIIVIDICRSMNKVILLLQFLRGDVACQ